MSRSRKFEEELKVRKRPSAPVDAAREEHGLAHEALRLQELVGNKNTTAAIARSPLQRDDKPVEADTKKAGEEKKASGYTMTMAEIGTFELLSFSWGASKGGGSGGGGGKQEYSDLTVMKRHDEHSAKLAQYAAEGKPVATVEVLMQGAGGTMTVTLKTVYISGFQLGTGEPPIETLTLTFSEMEWKLPEGEGTGK